MNSGGMLFVAVARKRALSDEHGEPAERWPRRRSARDEPVGDDLRDGSIRAAEAKGITVRESRVGKGGDLWNRT